MLLFRRPRRKSVPAPEFLTGHAAFQVFDGDGSGSLDIDEVRQILQRPGGGQPLSDEEVADIIADFDKNGDGLLQYDEFAVMWGVVDASASNGPESQQDAPSKGKGKARGEGSRKKSMSRFNSDDERSGLSSSQQLQAAAHIERQSAEALAERAASLLDETFERRLGRALLQRTSRMSTKPNKAGGGGGKGGAFGMLMQDWDKNGDGELSKQEFRQAVRSSLGLKAANGEIDALVRIGITVQRVHAHQEGGGGGAAGSSRAHATASPPGHPIHTHTTSRRTATPPHRMARTAYIMHPWRVTRSPLRVRVQFVEFDANGSDTLSLKELRPCLRALQDVAAAASDEVATLEEMCNASRERAMEIDEAVACMVEVESEEMRFQEATAAAHLALRTMDSLLRKGTVRIEDMVGRFKGVDAQGAIGRKAFRKVVLDLGEREGATPEECDAWFDEELVDQGGEQAAADVEGAAGKIHLASALKRARQAAKEAKEAEGALKKGLAALRRDARALQLEIKQRAQEAAMQVRERELAAQAAAQAMAEAQAEAARAKQEAKQAAALKRREEKAAFNAKVEERRSLGVAARSSLGGSDRYDGLSASQV